VVGPPIEAEMLALAALADALTASLGTDSIAVWKAL
jgi:hypothetical protein